VSTGTGINVSKLNAYAVLMPMPGVNVSKANAYAILMQMPGVSVSKANAYAVLMSPNVAAPFWPSFSFHPGVLGNPYYEDWDLVPAAAPTTYTVTAGALPDGLSLTSVAADVGKIDGTPSVLGTFTFTLHAANAFGAADKACTIIIQQPAGGGGGATFF
jgi:hypothetical protein